MVFRSLKHAALASALALASAPALAQVHIDLPGVEIHVGHRAPPPVKHEHRPPRPAAEYVWVGGAWDWQATDWVWMPGRWERPVYAHAHWVAPVYRHEGDAWRYEPGHWNKQKLTQGEDYQRWHEQHARGDHHHWDDQGGHPQDERPR